MPVAASKSPYCVELIIVRQVREKSEASDAIGGNPITINDDRAVDELAEVIPVEVAHPQARSRKTYPGMD